MVVHLRQIVRRIEHQCLDVEPADGAEQRVGGDHAIALRASLHQATRSGPQSRRLSGLRVQLQLTTWSTAPIPPITMTCSRATPVGPTGCAGFELTHRQKVTPSSMWRPNSTQATRKTPVNSTGSWVGACPNYQFLGDAAGLITDTSWPSVMHVRHEGRGHFRFWHKADVTAPLVNVRFSNRPFGVKHFQTIHQCGVDVARGLVLLFGIGTEAFPSWDSRTRRNNLLVGLAVEERRVQADIRTHLLHRPPTGIFPPLAGAPGFSHRVFSCTRLLL